MGTRTRHLEVAQPAFAGNLVLQDDVQSVDDTGQVTQDGEQNVDEQISTASSLQENTQRGQDDGEDDLADVASGEGHGCEVRFVAFV